MPNEISPSSCVCDCGYESDHFENTIRNLKRLSLRTRQCLGADDGLLHRLPRRLPGPMNRAPTSAFRPPLATR
jgi:hypothetical protein